MKWGWPGGRGPELDAEILSGSCRPEELVGRLEPLVRGYGEWIRSLEKVNPPEEILKGLRSALERMERGLELLRQDEDARMAFAFANRALWQQAIWAGRGGLKWRPFQLAFLLSTVESAVREDSPERLVCDVLWVPTGGGKAPKRTLLW